MSYILMNILFKIKTIATIISQVINIVFMVNKLSY